MSNNVLVSVIIPLYNHEEFIIKALNSVVENNYPHKEIIIINDGSTDSSHQLALDWIEEQGKEISIDYQYRENQGVAKTLNELISKASGRYITILASDDYLLPESLSSRVNFLQKNRNKLAVFGDCVVVDSHSKVILKSGIAQLNKGRPDQYYNDTLLRNEIIYHWAVPGSTLMLDKAIIDQVGLFNPKLEVEDWDFYLKMVAKNLLGYIDVPVSAYRVHDHNATQFGNIKKKHLDDLIATIRSNISLFKGYSKLLAYLRLYKSRLIKLSILLKVL